MNRVKISEIKDELDEEERTDEEIGQVGSEVDLDIIGEKPIEWKNICFLPFQMMWKITIIFGVTLQCCAVSFFLTYAKSQTSSFLMGYYVFELFYAADVLLAITHRCITSHQKTQTFSPRPYFNLSLDVISLMPYYEIYYLLARASKGKKYNFVPDRTKYKILLRIYKLPEFFITISSTPGMNHILACTLGHVTYYILYSILGGVVWYYLLSRNKDNNWMVYLQYHNVDSERALSWFAICSSVIGNCFAHNWSGLIFGQTKFEYLILIMTMLLGFLSHFMIFFGKLTSLFMKQISDQYNFSYKLCVISDMMKDWNVNKKTQRDAVDIYNHFWDQRRGIRSIPPMIFSLPEGIKKEIGLDIFWPALTHSLLFKNVEFAPKRHISVEMTSQFLMPGEYLFKVGDLRSQLIYIVSGVIQILSQEDQNSPVISFSGGTLLGEICPLMPTTSSVNLRCASYCEIHVMNLRLLTSALLTYKNLGVPLRKKLDERLTLARQMQDRELLKFKAKDAKTTAIRWVKLQWRSIAFQTRNSKKILDEKHQLVASYHTSRYLNLYVLSEEVELKTKTICLKSTCPFVLDPNSSFRQFFQYLITTSIIFQTLLLPYIVFFQRELSGIQSAGFYSLDCFYILGLILDISTAIKKSDQLVATFGQILIYKVKQISFLIDIIATCPWELLAITASSSHVFALLKINRMLKIYKVFSIIKKAELNVWVHYIRIRTIKYLIIVVCMVYFTSALIYGLTNFVIRDVNGWLFYNGRLRDLLNSKPRETISHFWLALEYVLSSVLSQSWGAFYAYSIKDIFLEQIVTIMGYFMYSFCFAEVGACAVLSHQARMDYQLYLSSLKTFATRRHLPNEMKRFIYTTVQCQWQYNQRFEIAGPMSAIRHLPEHLRSELLTSRIIECLKLIPMFFECDEKLLWKVAIKTNVHIFPPSTIITRPDTFCSDLHVIIRGHCLAESFIPTDKYHEVKMFRTTGACFPILEALMGINSFLKVTAITCVELAVISCDDLMKAIDKEDFFYRDLHLVTKQHFHANRIILGRARGRLPKMMPVGKSLGKGAFFDFDVSDEIDSEKSKVYNLETWNILGPWSFIRHIFMKNTLDPTKMVYTVWECFRCFISAIHVCDTIFLLHFMVNAEVYKYIQYFFQIIAVLDFYIRMHCRYYNADGILVSHPLYTAKYYLSTSFLLDLFCIFPIKEVEIHYFFGSYKKHGLLVLMLMTRPVLVHRIFSALNYLQETTKEGRSVLYHNAKYIMIVFVGVGVAASILKDLSCPTETKTSAFACPNDSWLYQDLFQGQESPFMTSVICYYVVMSIFATCTVGLFVFEKKNEILIMGFLSFTLFCLRWFLLAKITSSRIGGNTTLVHYQHNMKEFLKFAKKNYIKLELVEETVSHFEHIWKRTKGAVCNNILPSFHPVLRADICTFLYEPTLKLNEILCNLEMGAVRDITIHFTELHFKKCADIVRCNDVSDVLYIVHRGSVEIKIANDQLAVLTQGGMFGCFDRLGKTRLTITARAKIHVDLLTIDVETFYKVISRYKTATNRMRRKKLLNCEYFLPVRARKEVAVGEKPSELLEMETWTKGLLFTVNTKNKFYEIYNYVVNVHLSIASSLIIMTLVVKVGDFDIEKYFYLARILDVIFYSKIVLSVHTTFVDAESGVKIKSISRISKRYVQGLNFWFDLFNSFPFELFSYMFTNYTTIYRYLWFNRVSRFIYLIKYYNSCKNSLTVSNHLRWTYLMYSMVFLIHINVCIWWKIACVNEICTYYPKPSHEPIVLRNETDVWAAFRLAYVYGINVFTSTGIKIVVPITAYQLLTSIIMIGFAQLVLVVLTAGFASMLVLDRFEMTNFEKQTRKAIMYLQKINLSVFLRHRVWKYYVDQWTTSHGPWLPALLDSSPNYLKQDIMFNLYGQHLLEHFLFKKTHTDFLRQLVVHLELCVYLPGMYIVEKGDVDNAMYFLHDGEIIVYDKIDKLEIEQMVLTRGKTFGEPQGLYGIPHERSYKAKYTCKLVLLKQKRWEYLLKWFPASREKIIEMATRRFKQRLS